MKTTTGFYNLLMQSTHPSSSEVSPHTMSPSDWQEYWNGSTSHPPPGMSRYSIFFRLPYWARLKINHLVDPMHIFKNVAQNIWDHLIGARDSLGVREDMHSIGRLSDTWPREAPSGKIVLPKAPWILTKGEEKRVKGEIASFRTPIEYMRTLKGALTKTKKRGSTQLYVLKSHDWHKMLQVCFPLFRASFL